MTWQEIVSIVCGGLGIIVNALIFQQTSRDNILKFKFASDVLWGLQYLFKGAYSGLAIACIGMIREIIFMNYKHRWARSKLWLVLFIGLSLVSPIMTWAGWISLLPMTASVISVIAFWISRPLLTKLFGFPISVCQLTYGIAFQMPMSIINEILSLVSSSIGLIRYKREKKNQ